MKHTSGSWKIDYSKKGILSVVDEVNTDICILDSRPCIEANAKLIAAAPEMLDALISANNYFVDLQNKCALTNSDERAWKLISKAINKATE